MAKLILNEVAVTPPPPSVGSIELYAKTDDVVYVQDSSGTEVPIGTPAAITDLTADVSASGPGSVPATVNSVGGSSAANINLAELAANSATALNTANKIVKRDGSGNFAAGTITADLIGNVTGNVNGVDPAAHASRHLPAGADAITTAAPTTNLDAITTNAVGTANSLARSDHSHAISTGTPSTQIPDQANATGTSANLARADHTHDIPSGTPVQIGTSNFAGAAASFALSDHVHSHGNQTSTTLHALATASLHGFMSSTDKTLLDTTTSSNVADSIVKRDGSGNFAAGTITASLTGTASNNVLRAGDTMTGKFVEAVVALTDAATIVTDASLGNIFTVTLGGNRTLGAPTNPTNGQKIVYRIRQDGTGNRTLAFNAIFRFGLDIISFAASTGANKTDYIGCIYNSADSSWDIVAISKGF